MSENKNDMKNIARSAPKRGRGPGAVEKPKDMSAAFKRLIGYMGHLKTLLIITLLFALISTALVIAAPQVLGVVTTELYNGAKSGVFAWDKIIRTLIILLCVYVFGQLFAMIQNYIMAKVTTQTVYKLRRDLDTKLNRLSLSYIDKMTYGEILSRATNDIETINMTLEHGTTQAINSVFTVIGVFIMMLLISPIITVIVIALMALSLVTSSFTMKRSQKYFIGQQRGIGRVNSHIEETYSAHTVVQAFNQQENVEKRFDELNDEIYNNAWRADFFAGTMMPASKLFGNLSYVAAAAIGCIMVINKTMQVGQVQAFIQYTRRFSQPIGAVMNIMGNIQSALAAAERVFEVIDEKEEIPDPENAVKLENIHGDVVFDHVRFGYDPEKPVIRDLSISVKRGQTIAIVGPTGAGKTTLINLLMRFYEVDSGTITVDGVDIRDMKRDDLRDMFGMVLQDTWLFSGTIEENLAYGKESATHEEVITAAKQAFIHRFITTMPDGYDMRINEDASNISQGQKQLLTIARAIVSEPSIMILDEATSSVDTRTEVLIQTAMNRLMKDRTSFVIAHRLSTIRGADLILVMKDGDVIEHGSHDELMALGGFYSELWGSQFEQSA